MAIAWLLGCARDPSSAKAVQRKVRFERIRGAGFTRSDRQPVHFCSGWRRDAVEATPRVHWTCGHKLVCCAEGVMRDEGRERRGDLRVC